ncbi:MAG: hypothetical protein Q9184_006387, partial [Pyrenodesmia sp. 2 TL-2023]
MSLLGRIFADDEELGKKDDDRKRGKKNILPTWSARKSTATATWPRRRAVLFGLIACFALYFFFKNIPKPDHPPMPRPRFEKPHHHTSPTAYQSKVVPGVPSEAPPRSEKPSEAEKHYYDGPIRFYSLAVSLHAIARLGGHREVNNNVLFAVSNLKSATELIPIACEMASWYRNDVHMAFMGRDDLKVDEIKILNGVDEQCNVHWHDARPDYSLWSSDFRMEVSVSAALGHIQGFMHPQVVITNDPSREDAFFTRAIRARAFELGKTVIELPTDASENLMWIARLDSGSLAGKVLFIESPQFSAHNVLAWQTTYVDILIHAPPHSSGSLLRLLKSIEAADYFGHRRPHLTIELPADVDPPTWAFLEELTWPPLDWSGTPHQSQVTLRHRIPQQAGTPEEASARQLESFYPARPAHSHVLVLSPQIELSPMYFHYLLYRLLEYRYSSMTSESPQTKNLVGLSLELPSTHLNDSTPFSPPRSNGGTRHGDQEDEQKSVEEPTSFLWQAPNSNAALYFGDKWIELHSFLTSRFANDPTKQPGRRKLISEIYPSWLEFLQELMRARGYTMLYPIFASGGRDAIASLHYELFQPPEEFSKRPKPTSEADAPIPPLNPKETFETDPAKHRLKPEFHSESTPLTSNVLSLLPESALPTDLSDLPLLSHDGNALDPSVFESTARIFANDFRRTVGQCSATYNPK